MFQTNNYPLILYKYFTKDMFKYFLFALFSLIIVIFFILTILIVSIFIIKKIVKKNKYLNNRISPIINPKHVKLHVLNIKNLKRPKDYILEFLKNKT